MAAKKITEFVKGKISNQNISSTNFNAIDNQSNQSMNAAAYQKFSEFQELPLVEDDDFECSNDTPSSTKSSPGTKSKWGTHIIDVKKNINNAMEDAYSTLNTLIKGDGRQGGGNEVDSSTLRTSKTMGDFDKMEIQEDVRDCVPINKSVDNLLQKSDNNTENGSGTQLDIDSVDFKWFTTPKNDIRNRKKVPEKYVELPKLVQQSLIETYEFPKSRYDTNQCDTFKSQRNSWKFIVGILLIVIIMYVLSLAAVLGFILGAGMCYMLLVHYKITGLNSQESIMTLPRLKDLLSPAIPHIKENNEEDFDLYSSIQSRYSCWINILGFYDANTYNINQCQVVHLDIEDKVLRIRRPKKKIAHRAVWKGDDYLGVTFISEIVLDIRNARVGLLPVGLVHKRLWSKKYPICITFPKALDECFSGVGFSDILNSKSHEIYFFARTCRDKEEAFRRLLNVCNTDVVDLNMWNIVQQYLTKPVDSSENISKSSLSSKSVDVSSKKLTVNDDSDDKKVTYRLNSKDDEDDQEASVEALRRKSDHSMPLIAEYVKYMAKFMPSDMFLLTSKVMRLDINYVTCSAELLCINAFLGRIFWDFLRGSHWVDIISNKIQCKLQKIHLPQFMDELTVVDIHLGKEIPLIRKLGRPYLNSRGLWFEADIAYIGGFSMILETKVNLFNLRNQIKKIQLDEDKKPSESRIFNNEENPEYDIDKKRSRYKMKVTAGDKTAAFVSSEEDSAESSSYSEDSGDESKVGGASLQANVAGGGSSKRLIRWVDKIARSPYFIKAADNKYIQRGMEMVSNTKLMLQVELHSISGTLAINIPPPPSDRVWFGFRPSPIIKLSAKPKVGQKEISISKITDLIEKKLLVEFQRILVLPNMDDVPLPLLVNGNLNDYISNSP